MGGPLMQAATRNDTVAHPLHGDGLQQLLCSHTSPGGPTLLQTHCCEHNLPDFLSRPTGQSLANNDPWGADHPPTKHLRLLISTSLAQATRNAYATGMRQFIRFCKTCQGPIVATRSSHSGMVTPSPHHPATTTCTNCSTRQATSQTISTPTPSG